MGKRIIPAFLCVAAAVCCCSKYEESPVITIPGGSDVISAMAEDSGACPDSDTRAKLNEKNEVVWAESDKISIVGTSSATFTLSSGAGTKSGNFSGNLSEAGDAPHFAVMPYDESAVASKSGVTFLIPQKKGAQKNNIANSINPMAGKVNGGGVYFHNLFGLLKLTLTSEKAVKIKKIALHDLGGNMLWGNCFIPMKADTLDYRDIRLSGGDNTITMVWNSSPTINSDPKSYFFPLPPGSLDRGFSLVFYEDDNGSVGRAYTFAQKTSNPIAAERSVILALTVPAFKEMSEPSDVKARGYYKTLFVNAGCKLSNYYRTSDFKWLTTLGLVNDYEYFAGDSVKSVISQQASVLNKNSKDDNGVLLYPDGEPRFRMVYCNGGKSSSHGRTLYKDGRKRFHDFYYNGGSYVGTCAGGFLARSQYNGESCYDNSDTTKNYGFGIWPGTLSSSGMPKNNTYFPSIYTAQKIMMDFGPFHAGDTIEQVRHHGGFYVDESSSKNYLVPHDILMKYQYTTKRTSDTTSYTEYNRTHYMIFNLGKTASRNDKVSMIAYKASDKSGRAVLCGSHPEKITSGNNLHLMESMVNYAMEGSAPAEIKGDLKLNYSRRMDMSTSDNSPAYTRIGDRQYHHFRFIAASDIEDFKLILSGGSSADLHLALRRDDLAWRSDADYVLCNGGSNKEISIKRLPAGTWYVSVYCATTVTATAKTGSSNLAYFAYSGNTDVLNGVPYMITITGR